MRIKKPLLSTLLFASILFAGVVVLYFLLTKALEMGEGTVLDGTI
jgi:hypothetical protein